VQIGDQLIPELSNIVVTIENIVVVSKMVPLLLWTERPDGARNQSSKGPLELHHLVDWGLG
jgi:hypothetical protein